LVIDQSFISQLIQMLVTELVGEPNGFFVPTIIPGLVTVDQKDGCSPGIERIQCPVWTAFMLGSRLSHVRVS